MIELSTAATPRRTVMAHLIAGALALLYAWNLSGTRFVTTGLQFVAPLAVILVAHLLWLAARRQLHPGFAHVAFARTAVTAFGISALSILTDVVAPMPAGASNNVIETVGMVIACLLVLALVVGVAAFVIYGFSKIVRAIYRAIRGPKDPGGGKLHDFGAVALALCAIGTASLEGVIPALTFAGDGRASSSVVVAAPPERLWQEIGRATSPEFPLPLALKSIPQPVAVLVDEGAALGARRIVRFKGREGEGDLALKVIRRTDTEAVFEAVSDDSPIAMWIRHKALTFRVDPHPAGLKLTVTLDYERQLAPAWFFGPFMRQASTFAVDVLARDTKERAEKVRAAGRKFPLNSQTGSAGRHRL
jgi:hypothetical protein